MCGVCGIFYYRDEGRKAEEPLVRRMTTLLLHRGPDEEGFFFAENFGMGARRLRIIDIAGGSQPVHNEDRTLWVVFNGEIYNFRELRDELLERGHVFYTRSDTEVLVHLYEEEGERFLDRLRGMFAFVIFDTKKREAFIARDRIGIKPLYYYEKDGLFLFGSEIKALVAHPCVRRELDVRSLNDFLSLNYIPGPGTIFKEIRQVPFGSSMTVSSSGIRLRRYWDLRYSGYLDAPEEAIAEQLYALLGDSVKRHLVSDVEVGAFLSGGLDSSSLVAFATRFLRRPLKTFCIGFDERLFDERSKAREVSAVLGTEHHDILCQPKDVAVCLPKLVWQADNLLADPAMFPLYLVSGLAKSHVDVVLSGDGSDEMFAGYPTYRANIYRNLYRLLPPFIRRHVITPAVGSLPASTGKPGFDYAAKKFIAGAEFTREKAHHWWRTIFSDEEKCGLLAPEIAALIGDADSFRAYKGYFESADFPLFASKCLYADLKVWLPDNNLARVDAVTMGHALETRVPFLDHEVVEFAAKIPFHLKLNRLQPKYILRQAVRTIVPDRVLRFKKSPWHVPLADWFRGELRGYVADSLLGSAAVGRFFNRARIETLLKEHAAGRQNHSFKMWGLLVFAHWHSAFKPTGFS